MPFYPEGGDGTPQPQPFTLDDVLVKMGEMKGHENATFSVQWRDFEDEAIRVCAIHLPAAVRKMYRQYGYTFSVEVRLINESAGFPCEHEE
jgi:hypothetical protein